MAHVTRVNRSQLAAWRQEGSGGAGPQPHRERGTAWGMGWSLGCEEGLWGAKGCKGLHAYVGGTPFSSGAPCMAVARGLALAGAGPGSDPHTGQELFVPILPAEPGAFVLCLWALPRTWLLGFRLAPPGMT